MKTLYQDFWYVYTTSSIDVRHRAAEKDYPYLVSSQTSYVYFAKRKHAVKIARHLKLPEENVYHTTLYFVTD